MTERPVRVLLVTGIFTLMMAACAATLRLDLSFFRLLDDSMPEVRRFLGAVDNFGEPVNFFLVVEPPDLTTGKKFIADVEKELRTLPMVKSTESRMPVDYIRRYGVWLLPEDKTKELSEGLDAVLPVLEDKEKHPLESLLEIAATADESDASTWPGGAEGRYRVHQAVDILNDVVEGREPEIPEDDELQEFEELLTGDGYYRDDLARLMLVIIRTNIDPMEIRAGMPEYKKMLDVMENVRARYSTVDAGFTGLYAIGYEDQTSVLARFRVLSVVSLIVMMLIFFYYTRIKSTPVILGVSLVAAVVWTFGISRFTVGYVSLMTLIFGLFLFGLGIDFAIHLVMRYVEARGGNGDPDNAMRTAITRSGPGVVTGGLTTTFAFAVLMLSGFKGGAQLGVTTSVGLLCCLTAMLTIFPALVVIWHRRNPDASTAAMKTQARWIDAYVEAVCKKPVMVLILCGVITAILVPLFPKFKMVYDLDRMIYRDIPARELKQKIEKQFKTNTDFAMAFADTIPEVEEKTKRLEAKPSIKKVESIADWLPEPTPQRRKAVRLVRRLTRAAKEFRPFTAASFKKMADRLPDPASIADRPKVANVIKYIKDHRDDESVFKMVRTFEEEFIEEAREKLELLENAAPQQPPRIQDLPPQLRDRLIAKDGRYPLVVYPKRNTMNQDAMKEFKADLHSVCPNAAGIMMMAELMTTAGMDRLPYLCGLALLLIFIIIYIDFRNLRDTALALLPVTVAGLWTFGLLCLMGAMITMFIGIAFPLVVGIGVDDGVHLIHRMRQQGGPAAVRDAVRLTGRPIFMTTLTTMAGFGILLLTNHNGLIGMGATIVLGVGLCFITSITILPAVLTLIANRKK